jgi:sugar diacid utilization regulator
MIRPMHGWLVQIGFNIPSIVEEVVVGIVGIFVENQKLCIRNGR